MVARNIRTLVIALRRYEHGYREGGSKLMGDGHVDAESDTQTAYSRGPSNDERPIFRECN